MTFTMATQYKCNTMTLTIQCQHNTNAIQLIKIQCKYNINTMKITTVIIKNNNHSSPINKMGQNIVCNFFLFKIDCYAFFIDLLREIFLYLSKRQNQFRKKNILNSCF